MTASPPVTQMGDYDAALSDLLERFKLRAWARAYLYAGGWFELQEAVDALQVAAERSGLVYELGQDRIQQIIAGEFEAVRC